MSDKAPGVTHTDEWQRMQRTLGLCKHLLHRMITALDASLPTSDMSERVQLVLTEVSIAEAERIHTDLGETIREARNLFTANSREASDDTTA